MFLNKRLIKEETSNNLCGISVCVSCGDIFVFLAEGSVSIQLFQYVARKSKDIMELCAVREEGYQVFIIEEEAKDEKIIYNFDRPEEYVTLTYNDYRFVRTNGEHRYEFLPGQLWYVVCKFTESGEVDYSNDIGGWIDGVGNLGTNPFAFELPFLPLDMPKLGKRIGLRSCMKDGKYIYNPEWMTMPTDPTIVDSKHIDNLSKGNYIFDLQGRKMQNIPDKGIYIVNGQKRMVK